MILNRLSILLAERNLRATRVSVETGIARSTLSSLVNNDSKMIQIETINTLCEFLKIPPSDFFDYLPFDLVPKILLSDFIIDGVEYSGNSGLITDIYNFTAELFIQKKQNGNEKDIIEMDTHFINNPAKNPYGSEYEYFISFSKHSNEDLSKLKKLRKEIGPTFFTALEKSVKITLKEEIKKQIEKISEEAVNNHDLSNLDYFNSLADNFEVDVSLETS